jgi:hypothetical protein
MPARAHRCQLAEIIREISCVDLELIRTRRNAAHPGGDHRSELPPLVEPPHMRWRRQARPRHAMADDPRRAHQHHTGRAQAEKLWFIRARSPAMIGACARISG